MKRSANRMISFADDLDKWCQEKFFHNGSIKQTDDLSVHIFVTLPALHRDQGYYIMALHDELLERFDEFSKSDKFQDTFSKIVAGAKEIEELCSQELIQRGVPERTVDLTNINIADPPQDQFIVKLYDLAHKVSAD